MISQPAPAAVPSEIAVVNVGLPLFADAVRAQGRPVDQLDWRIPAGGDAQLIAALTTRGWPLGVAQWMATNLVRDNDAFVWRLDLDVMEQLLRSFFSTDLWPIVEHPAPGHVVHFVKASQSSAMSDDAVRRAESLPSDRAVVHHLDGGHWIHAESPQAIVDLLAQGLR